MDDYLSFNQLPVIDWIFLQSIETSIGATYGIAFVLLLLCCSALLSASEVAFFSLTVNEINRLRTQDNPTPHSQNILRLIETPRTLLATMLIGNTFVNIAIVVVSELLIRYIFPEETFVKWAEDLLKSFQFIHVSPHWLSNAIKFSVTIIGVTFLLVLFCEVIPKIYAKANNLKLARLMARPLLILGKIFSPLVKLMVRSTNIIEKRFEGSTQNANLTSKEDINKAIELTVSKDVNAAKEMDILKSIIQFGDTTVKQIMHSRPDVIAIEVNTDYRELLNIVKSSGFSRYPVYEEDLDNMKGIIYSKDLLDYLDEKNGFEWQKIIHNDIKYVPESKKIDSLLRELQAEKVHMAIAVDEYGGTAGMVTLEDIMEEVIGEIKDEFDDAIELDYKKIDNFTYIFDGKILLNDVYKILKIDSKVFSEVRGDADSLAGLILELVGYIPKKDFEIAFKDYRFKILSANKRRIEQIKVTLPK